MSPRPGPRFMDACAAGLVVMATWTIVVKYLAPILWAAAERAAGRDVAAPIMWDFWWAPHLLLAWMLWRRHPRVRPVGAAIAGVEVAIVSAKFAAYFQAPEFTFWKLLWLTNKMYVLSFFLLFLVLLATDSRARGRDARGAALVTERIE